MNAVAIKATIYLHPDALAEIRKAAGNSGLDLEFHLSCAAVKHAADLRYKRIMGGVNFTPDAVETAFSANQKLMADWFAPVKQIFKSGN